MYKAFILVFLHRHMPPEMLLFRQRFFEMEVTWFQWFQRENHRYTVANHQMKQDISYSPDKPFSSDLDYMFLHQAVIYRETEQYVLACRFHWMG